MGISIWQLLIILAIVLVIFGTKKLRDFGGDLGGAIKNFKTSVKDESGKDDAKDEKGAKKSAQAKIGNKPIEGKVTAKETSRQKKKA